jgi:hypothetical protein
VDRDDAQAELRDVPAGPHTDAAAVVLTVGDGRDPPASPVAHRRREGAGLHAIVGRDAEVVPPPRGVVLERFAGRCASFSIGIEIALAPELNSPM